MEADGVFEGPTKATCDSEDDGSAEIDMDGVDD